MTPYVVRRRLYETSYRKRQAFGLKATDFQRINKIQAKLDEYSQYKVDCIDSGKVEEAIACIDCMVDLTEELFRLQYVPLTEWKTSVPRLPFENRKLSFDCFAAENIDEMFGFASIDQLRQLKTSFHIADTIYLDNRFPITGEELVMIGLYRLRSPRTLSELQRTFSLEFSITSRAVNTFLHYLARRWGYILLNNIHYWADSLGDFCEAIRKKRQELVRRRQHHEQDIVPTFKEDPQNGFKVCTFLDATVFSICRPGGGPVHPAGVNAERHNPDEQRAFYTGHKRLHGMKIQTSTLPNGITLFASIPESARTHDSLVLERSNFLHDLLEAQRDKPWFLEEGVILKAHGDPAYSSQHVALSSGGTVNIY
jgi:hypothetical protein